MSRATGVNLYIAMKRVSTVVYIYMAIPVAHAHGISRPSHGAGQVALGVQLGMGGEGLSTVVRCNTTYKCDLTLWYHCTTGLMQQIEPIATVVTTYGTTLSVLSIARFLCRSPGRRRLTQHGRVKFTKGYLSAPSMLPPFS